MVPATRPMDAVGAIAMRVALRMPPLTFARSASQSRRVVRLTLIGDAAVGSVSAIDVERHESLRPARALEVRVGAALLRQVGALVDRRVGDVLHDLVDQVVRLLALVAEAEPLDDVGEAHDAEADGAVLLVGVVGLVDARDA